MRTIKLMSWILVFSLLLTTVLAATIQGSVYDDAFNELDKAIITINTQPEQKMLSSKGSYSFNVPEGMYTITANVNGVQRALSAQENIEVPSEGTFNIDLFLFPSIQDTDDLITETEVISAGLAEEPQANWNLRLMLLGWLIICIILIRHFWKKAQHYKAYKHDDLLPFVDYIKKHKRTTQKEMRNDFPLSEAKISLIITELEKKGIVEKIKKGRGNVIILKK